MINMQAIQSASVEQYPWQHLSIDGVLDTAVYDLVLQLWPENMEPSDFKGRGWKFIYPSEDVGFWRLFGRALGESAELKSVVFDKLGVHEKKSTHCEVRLITDIQGYACKPHCDTATKIVSMLLYCPLDSNRPHWGTRLGEMVHKKMQLVKVEPFVPNHAFIFAQAPDRIHWVDEIDDERRQILICWMM